MDDKTLAAGLDKVLAATPVGHGFADIELGADEHTGLYAKAEAGFKPLSDVALYGFAQATDQAGVMDAQAGLGAKWTF